MEKEGEMQPVYLITGGAGNLACQLTFPLAGRGIRCVLLDVAAEPVAPVAEGCQYVRGDVTNAEEMKTVFRDYEPRVVVHFASLLSAASEADRPAAWELNANGAFALLEMALAHRVDRFFFPSSLAAYGGALPDLISDHQVQWPDGMYGVTKTTVERLGVYYARRHGLDFRGLRLLLNLPQIAIWLVVIIQLLVMLYFMELPQENSLLLASQEKDLRLGIPELKRL